ncbi:MAG: hypothetical protein HKN15_05635 [Xanthomonadales bacterium]|nr:hypothetical protein [Xanthomonadales bacterium]
MRALARLSLILVLVLVAVSAYLRLHDSGIGCADFPACYALIGEQPKPAASTAENAYQRIVAESDAPLAWAAPLHRLVASLLGLAVLALNVLAFKNRQRRLICLALLALTVFLAVIGLKSGGLHHPAIVLGNLVGGFLLLGLLGWLVYGFSLGAARYMETRIRHLRPLLLAALVALGLQILIGGLTSANFAATACQTFPTCNGAWLPDATLYTALRIDEPHEIDARGYAVGGPERVSVHQAHRIMGIVAFMFIFAAAVAAIQATEAHRKWGIALLVLLLLEFSAGIASVLTGLPIMLAVSHNWLAALLLLVLLKLLAISREKWWPG